MPYILGLFIVFYVNSLHALTSDDVIQKILDQRVAVKDWSAIYTQETSGGLLGQGDVEMGRITVKGEQIRKDIQRPIRKTRIQTPFVAIEKDDVSGDVITTDLTQKTGPMGVPRMTPETALQQFAFEVVSENATEIVMVGVQESVRMEMTVDAVLFVPIRMVMDLPGGTRMTMLHSYATVSGIPMMVDSETVVTMKMGTRTETMKVHVVYKNLKVNTGVADTVFVL